MNLSRGSRNCGLGMGDGGCGPLIFAFYLLFSVLCSLASAGKYGGGSGTAESPFLIYTTEDFITMSNTPSDWDKSFKLMRDIDLSGYDERNFRALGRWFGLGVLENKPFSGTLDGNGRTISNFRYKDVHQEYVGLFSYVTGVITNLELVQATVIGDASGTGALVGYLERGGVRQCSASRVYVSGNLCVGGLVGLADSGLGKCSVRGQVSGISYVGGLVGQCGKGTLFQSYSKATVVGNDSVGGLAGAIMNDNAVVDSCYASGGVDGSQYVGGLVGQVVQGTLFRCYSTGPVAGKSNVGGFVGSLRVLGKSLGSFWDTEASRQATSPGSQGKTTAEMRTMDTYLASNWDFINVWTICDGINYPVLLWQIPRGDLVCPDGVDWVDFVWFARNWRHNDCVELNSSCEGADLDSSGSVEYPDLAIFAETWLDGMD